MARLFLKGEKMSSLKRRDNKGRILQNGETQDASGRYVYRYTDPMGKRKSIYSWRLTQSDPVPSGKKFDIPLREKEKQVQMDIYRGIYSEDMTVCELVERYLETKTGVRHTTRAGYKTVINILKKEPFGQKKIKSIKLSDAKLFLIRMQEDGRRYSSIHSIRGVLRPAFQMAVDDEMLLRNPFEFQLATVLVNDSVTREAISREDERRFLKFVQEDSHFNRYYDGMFILFKTGLRISEFCGLTIRDIDFKNRILNIDHQLQRASNMEYVIQSTKTSSGTRRIPMTDEVAEAFKRIIENRRKVKVEPAIAGYTGFLYLDKNNMPMVALHWEKYFQHAVQKYNSIYKLQLPKITPHVCRHTFCSNMAKSGINPKTLQYLMGHSEIGVTLNTYTHIKEEDAKAELEKLGFIRGMENENKTIRLAK